MHIAYWHHEVAITKRRWCSSRCSRVRAIAAVTGEELVQLAAVAVHLLPDVVQHRAAAVRRVHLVHHRGHPRLLAHLAGQHDLTGMVNNFRVIWAFLIPVTCSQPSELCSMLAPTSCRVPLCTQQRPLCNTAADTSNYGQGAAYRAGNLTQAAAFLLTRVQTCSWQGDRLSGMESPTLPWQYSDNWAASI